MTVRDLIGIPTGNLWRMKLRTVLTASGVMIAIAAFVSMLSFGAGNQEYIEGEFNRLGLFTTMQVFPRDKGGSADTSSPARLDRAALDRLAAVPGVNLVYPYVAFPVEVRLSDSIFSSRAQALPAQAMRTKLFGTLLAGAPGAGENAREAIISEDLMRRAGITAPESTLGLRLIVAVRVSTVDSGLSHILVDGGESLLDRLKRIRFDSLAHREYRNRVIHREASETLRRFLSGFLNARQVVADTLRVAGVRRAGGSGRIKTEPVMIPVATAGRFDLGGLGGSPADIFAAMSNGTLFAEGSGPDGKTFPQATIDFDPKVVYTSIKDSIEALGFRTFSFAEQFKEIQRVFLYFDMALGVVGLIALVTASLGIVNTMIMSIMERKREIGVLKSLGADDRDIRGLFLVESAVIGLMGTTGGIVSGWIISRIVSAVAQAYMRGEGIPEVELFALPPWLMLIALAVGVGVSIAAGLYPAVRAARVDPVEALRND